MTINKIAANVIELCFKNGNTILLSYNTPVAAFLSGKGYVKTEEFHSTTTSKHINKWIGPGAVEVPQVEIDALLCSW